LGKRLKTFLAQEGEENNRVIDVCERNVRMKGNEAWENRIDGFMSEYVYQLSYHISFFVSS
jgi:hypothetical protein